MKTNTDNISVLLFSGGLDSTTVLYWLLEQQAKVLPLMFYYGQKHSRELVSAHRIISSLGMVGDEITLPSTLFINSSLTSGAKGASVIVPNRNMVILSSAAAYAYGRGIERVYIGCNADDEAAFPDCTRSFIRLVNMGLLAAKVPVKVIAPFIHMSKLEIARYARELKVPIASTYSCYRGAKVPCGKCLSCVLRRKALSA